MSKQNGAPASASSLPEDPLFATRDNSFASTLWDETPALSWVMNLEDGQFRASGTHPDADVSAAPLAALGRILRTLVHDQHSGPVQFVGVLPALDGTLHRFLIIGAPTGLINGDSPQHYSGVAIDVTGHQQRIDQLAQQALIDELTCVYNRRGFLLFAEHELKVAQRRRTRSAILYVDVDGLKQVNDARGHGDGDAMLVKTATLLRRVFRECDVIGRLGGDEFAVFAADVRDDPESLSRRLRAEVPVLGSVTGRSTGLALSMGVASCEPGTRMPLSALIAAADQAMYRSKDGKATRAADPLAVKAAGRRGTNT